MNKKTPVAMPGFFVCKTSAFISANTTLGANFIMMQIQIRHTTYNDIEPVFSLYNDAIAYQKQVGNNHWYGFERAKVEAKLMKQGTIPYWRMM
ncbi:hypothetical protein [Mucilaginibacter pedocola]|uniref:hypothetical protein n=1 Tax=Mucilaginibacter pedocola TaxID=1792845 RepID=UPI000994773F|nr:hypothetical protein [Mucilaginibacter pedocola]